MHPSRVCFALLLLVAAVGVGRAGDETAGRLTDERAADEKAYAEARDALHRDHPGKWVVIAHGEVVAISEELDDVLAAGPDARHRFVFRVGDEGDGEVAANFWYGPRFAGGQLPRALGFDFVFRAGGTGWRREDDDRRFPSDGVKPFPRTAIQVGAPGEKRETLGVFVGTVGPPLMLTPGDFERLGLARYEVPGTWTALRSIPCRRALVEASVAGVEEGALLVATAPSVSHEKLVDLQRGRDFDFFQGAELGFGIWATMPEARRQGWVLFGVDRVLGRGDTPAEALRAGEGRAPETPHRFLSHVPRPDELVLNEADFTKDVNLVLGGEDVRVREGPSRDGPRILLADRATARRLALELAEQARCVFVRRGDRRLHARMGAAWVGRHRLGEALPDDAPTPELVWVVHALPEGETVWYCEPPPELPELPGMPEVPEAPEPDK